MSPNSTGDTTTAKLGPGALQALIRDGGGPRLLDVRTPGEFQSVHIPGSYNVPLDTLKEHRQELLSHLDEDVVLICRSGGRAAQAEQALAEAGLPNLRVLDGGMVAWETSGGDVRRGADRWDLERQVRLVAGLIVLISGVAGVFFPGWHLVGTFVGAGLTFAAVSNTCAMGMMLSKLPYNRGPKTDLKTVIQSLRGDRA
ncbi:rhodanese-like domain-containing protein [Streptomyces albus]|uniref:rhodanese-like domain-containing protein n=1 Tax=Streptomyces albus TaxID=1888 RepID=UPI0004CB1881|nr:rhodanese-like domain-containing protein [Streptomyces albus]